MDKEVHLPQSFLNPAADPVDPCINAGMIGGMSTVGYEADKGHRRRQTHVYDIPPAGSIGDHSSDAQLPEKFPGIPCRARGKPALLSQLYTGEEAGRQQPEIVMQ